MGIDRFTEHAQNLLGCEKCNLRKAVGILEMPIGCEISVMVQEGLRTCPSCTITLISHPMGISKIPTAVGV